MATNNRTLTRIYDLRVLGGDKVNNALKSINQALEENARLKALASKNSVTAEELAEIEKYKTRIKELTAEELKLKAAQKEATNEKRALAIATTEAANAAKKEKDALVAAQGSYAETKRLMAELRPLIQNANKDSQVLFQGKKLDFSQAISEYKRLTAAEQDFRRQFTKDNTLVGEYTTGILQAFKSSGLDQLIQSQVTKTKQQLRSLDENFDQLKKELSEIGVTGKGGFERIEREMIDNRNEANRLRASLSDIQQEMAGMGGVGARVTASINNGFNQIRSTLGSLVVGYVGFQAAINKGTQLVSDASEISDQITELRINMGATEAQSDALVESLSKINTRTALKGLLEISDVAIKAGTSNENLVKVTEAIDKVKVAFGKDFGSIEQGTETFVKLINIFYDDGEITGERILQIGNSIRAIANESVASVPYITDFNGRMAGLKQVFQDFTLSQSTGLAAGFEEFKQSAEVSSTVLVKVLPKLATDTEKYGAIVGMTADEFGKLLNNNPTEALIQVSEALVKNGQGVEEISAALADSELGSGRITTILATLGGKADVFRERIRRAGETIQSTDAITSAYTAKNNNLGATLDKISKKFNDIAGSDNFQKFLLGIATVLGGIATVMTAIPFPVFLASMLLAIGYTNTWLGAKLRLVAAFALEKGALVVEAAQMVINNGITATSTFLKNLYSSALIRSATATGIAAIAAKVLAGAMALVASPIGVVVGLVTALVTVVGVFRANANSASAALRNMNQQWRISNEITQRANQIASDQISKLQSLVSIVTSTATSYDTKRKALDELIKSNNKFSTALKGNVIDLNEVKRVMGEVRAEIMLNARAQASAELTAQKFQKVQETQTVREIIETSLATSGGQVNTNDLTKTQRKLVLEVPNESTLRSINGDLLIGGVRYDSKKYLKALKEMEDKAIANYEAYMLQQSKIMEQLNSKNNNATGGAGGGNSLGQVETVFQRFARFVREGGTEDDIKTLRDDIAKQKAGLNILSKEYKDLVALEKQIEEFLNPSKGGRGRNSDETATDRLKTAYEQEKKLIETQFNDKTINEQVFNEKLVKLATDYREKKLVAIKAANKKEKEQQVSFNAELAKDQVDANKKLFDILSQSLNRQLEVNLNNARRIQENETDDPRISDPDKINAKLDYLERELNAKRNFDIQMTALEERFVIDNVLLAAKRRDELEEIERQIRRTAYELAVASYNERLRLIEQFNQNAKNRVEAETNDKTIEILRSNKSPREQANDIKRLELDQTKALLAEEVKATRQAYLEIENARRKGLATQEEVNAAKNKASKARLDYEMYVTEQERSVLERLTDGLRNAWSNLTGFFRGVKATQKEALDAVDKAKEIIRNALSNAKDAYFQNQFDQVEREKQVAFDRLALEQQQLESLAKSEEEKDSIRRQFDAKRKEEERKAGEERKQIALKQATIDFALAVVKTLAAYPFPFSLIPVAGLSIAYALQRSQIQKQKFEQGGMPKAGGPIRGKSHAQGGVPFNYEAEDGELAIINKRSAMLNKKFTVTGTPRQIASAINQVGGGVRFAPGATVRKLEYGGLLGSNLNPPSDLTFLRNSNGYSGDDGLFKSVGEKLNQVTETVGALARQTNERIDKLKVQVVSQEVSEMDKEIKAAEAIGRLK